VASGSRQGARRTLLQFTFALSLITFLDRVALGSAAAAVSNDLGLTKVMLGWAFSTFIFAYAIFEIPSGWLGDRFGPRKSLTRIVIWWSVFCAATGVAWNLTSLICTQFLFGAGEAGAYPNISKSFSRWFPVRQRGFAHATVFAASRVGGAIAPPLVVLILQRAGWRPAFWVFGSFGAVWAWLWWTWFRDRPEDHPGVSPEELKEIQDGPAPPVAAVFGWRDLFQVNMLLVCSMYFCIIYGLYFYLTWLPTYFKEARGFSEVQAAWLSSMVLITGGVMALLGGWLTDWLAKAHGLKVGRSIGVVALPASGLCLMAAALVPNAFAAAVLFAAAAGLADMCLSPSWAICHDVGGNAVGTVTGAMNTFGNIGGALSPTIVAYVLLWWGSWQAPLLIGGSVYILGGILTYFIDPTVPLVREPASLEFESLPHRHN
jgi:MFS family permease